MKRVLLYITILTFAVTSCEGFLSVKPQTQVLAEDLFKQESGYEDALIGCYIKLNSQNLYGKFLTMSGIDYMAQYYASMAPTSDEYAFKTFDYDNLTVEEAFKNVYYELYNIILQANDIIEHVDSQDGLSAIKNESKRDFIKGEALAIRAFCHFDLLRIFGQVPQNATQLVSLPYSDKTGTDERPLLTYRKFVEKVGGDMGLALQLLENDPVRLRGLSNHNDPDDDFMSYRRFRFNYFAVKGLYARYALYTGKKTEAYDASMEIINALTDNGQNVVTLAGEDDFTKGHYTLPSETLIALSASELESMTTDLETIFKNGNSSTDPMKFDKSRRDALFQSRNTSTNNRYNKLWGTYSSGTGSIVPYMKKYFQNEVSASDEQKLADRWQIPLIRLSEMYLIAMETSTDLTEVNQMFTKYMLARNEQPSPFSDLQSAKDEILNEYRREFMAEGQMFFAYKRTGSALMLWKNDLVKESDYVIPIPKSEIK